LSELFGGIEGEPVQTELPGVRILFELLGFLLSRAILLSFATLRVVMVPDNVFNLRLQ
jgi:hypothetical protein